jgi:hypothetical protein
MEGGLLCHQIQLAEMMDHYHRNIITVGSKPPSPPVSALGSDISAMMTFSSLPVHVTNRQQ